MASLRVQPVMADGGQQRRGSLRYSNGFDWETGGRMLDEQMPEVGGRVNTGDRRANAKWENAENSRNR